MKKKKVLILIMLFSVLTVAFFALAGCDAKSEDLQFKDKVVGRYADGFRVSKTFGAPDSAQQFPQELRIEQNITIDTRTLGLHFIGIYLPKGENLTISVPIEVAQQGHKVVVNANSINEEKFDLNSVQLTVMSQNGGLVDLYIASTPNMQDNFNLVSVGGVQMPYYRLGIEKKPLDVIENGFVVLDAANIRMILPSELSGLILDIDKMLEWWRSTTEICNKITFGNSTKNAPSPTIIYAQNITGFELVQKNGDQSYKNIIKISQEELGKMLNYDALLNGNGWLLMQALGQLKVKSASGFGNSFAKDAMGYTVAALAYSEMTEANANLTNGQNWMTSAFSCLTATKDNNMTDFNKWASFFLNFRYSFGTEQILSIVQAYRDKVDDANRIDNFYVEVCKITNLDISQYMEFFGLQLSDSIKEDFTTFKKYSPIQTKYSIGGEEKNSDIGLKVPLGMVSSFKFDDSTIVSLFDEEIELSLSGTNGCWKKLDDGSYNYHPKSSLLTDKFKIDIVFGDQEVLLFGKINVDIRYASFKVFENVKERTIDKAIKEVKTKSPNFEQSVNIAEVPHYQKDQNDSGDNANKYNFSVTSGALQVEETGNYTFYLKSKGNCRVNFGVNKYMTEIFAVSLTVNEYTGELCYVAKLDADKTYFYNIYVLNTNGDGYAKLGIKNGNGVIVDVDNKFMVYNGRDRDNFVEFCAPSIDIDGFGILQADFNSISKEKWTIKSDVEAQENFVMKSIIDNSKLTSFKSKFDAKSFVFEIDLHTSAIIDLIGFEVGQEMLNSWCTVEGASIANLYEDITKFRIEEIKSHIPLENLTNLRYIRLTFTKKTDKFLINFFDFSVGTMVKESKILPDTNSRIVYQGEWKRTSGYASINGSVTENVDKNCAMIFSFYGSSFALYAVKAPQYGIADVFIDDRNNGTVSFYDVNVKSEQRIIEYNFEKEGLHTIKIVPHGKVDIINIDYITVIENDEQIVDKNYYNLWYLVIIPVVLISGLLICIIADSRIKKKKKVGNGGNCQLKE